MKQIENISLVNILQIVVPLLGIVFSNVFINKKGKSENDSKERIAVLEHSGESIDKLNKMIDEKIDIARKLTNAESVISKKDNEISELKRQLEAANNNINELLQTIKELKGETV